MRYFLLCVICIVVLANAEAQENDLTGRVYTVLADYHVNCEEVRTKPWAFVGKGVSVALDSGNVAIKDRWYVGCQQGKNSLFASAETYSSSDNKYREGWNQRFESDRGVLLRTRIYSDNSTIVVEELNDEERKKPSGEFHGSNLLSKCSRPQAI
ncbi:MAG: hypothetical protein F9B45_28995 [Phycisphaera sp. RhM]|nr:hypothetical protein [Phycisphaera sp. RhM]